MRPTKISLLLAAMFVATAVLAVVPTAEAQVTRSTLTITMNPPSESVKPLQAPLTFGGTVSFSGDPGQYQNYIGVPISYTVTKQPAWASVVVSPASDVVPMPGTPGQTYTGTRAFTIIVTASDQAPAFAAETIEITVTQGTVTGGTAATAKNAVPITADYFSILDVQLAERIKVERPQTPVQFPLKVTNLGNANTKVSFEIAEGTSESLQVPLPNPITLQSRQAGGNMISSDVGLTVQTPYKNGYMNEVGIANFKLTSAYALDPKLTGDDSSLSVLVTTRGFYVPGPSPILFLGLLGVLALVVRRFR